jgi:hypothetical protein
MRKGSAHLWKRENLNLEEIENTDASVSILMPERIFCQINGNNLRPQWEACQEWTRLNVNRFHEEKG